jgi:hypothetical protein
MQILKTWQLYIDHYLSYSSFCLEQPFQAPACRLFWTWVMAACFAIGVLAALVVVWKIVSHKLKLAAALRAQAERERIDHDAITAAKLPGDKTYSGELSAEEIERRIREAVGRPHLEDAAKRDRNNIV